MLNRTVVNFARKYFQKSEEECTVIEYAMELSRCLKNEETDTSNEQVYFCLSKINDLINDNKCIVNEPKENNNIICQTISFPGLGKASFEYQKPVKQKSPRWNINMFRQLDEIDSKNPKTKNNTVTDNSVIKIDFEPTTKKGEKLYPLLKRYCKTCTSASEASSALHNILILAENPPLNS